MIALIKALQLILALSILIVIHELGHFTFAKLFGIKVDKFFLFFDVSGVKLLSTKTGWFSKLFPKLAEKETEYGIGWLPLGGYCKISGMVDESMDTEFTKHEAQPWEFRSKPAWQRLLVMVGGVLFNFILAIGVYSGILAIWGQNYYSNEDNCIYVNDLAYDMGFRSGDRILKFDDYVPENFGMLQADLARQTASKATVLRDGDTLNIYIDHSLLPDVLNTPGMFDIAIPFVISAVPESSVNISSGLKSGDRIVGLDGKDIRFVQDARQILRENASKCIATCVVRDADTMNMMLQVDSTGMLGVQLQMPPIRTKEYSVLAAIPAGFNMTFDTIGGYLKDLKLVATPSTGAYKSVGSFIAIGQIFPSNWNWFEFLNIIALLSIMLGVMNLLPIPALDGGHVVFTLYEMITGRKPSDKFMYAMQIVGMILIFGLMFLAFGNDIARLFKMF
ncbi:MAG: RIP metalloprotease RseP [Bacteroidales bacterium]|nr:RIP metalloprotease RseP [Bacteroidales bacterium]MDD5912330.1 RIP metalloprotease RseP [Bacteroidales bacterium]